MALNLPVASFKTTLTRRISETATTIYLDSILDDEGNNLSGTFGFVIDEGTAEEEFVIGTIDSATSSIISCLRGISVVNGASEVTALKQEHRKKASIKITTHPYIVLALRVLNGTDPMGGVMQLPTTRLINSSRDVTDKEYVDATAAAAGGITAFYVTDNGGLTINVGAGYLVTDSGLITYAGAAAQAVTDASTNYVQISRTGALNINTTGFSTGSVPLATVVTSGGDITSVTDCRGWLTAPQSEFFMTDNFTYGDTISAGQAVYLDSADSKWKRANAGASGTAFGAFGIAIDAGVDTDTGKRVQLAGIVSGLSLSSTGYVYLKDVDGTFDTWPPGTYSKVIGYAFTTSTMLLIPTLDISALYGATTAWSTDTLTTAMNFFATPYNQPVRRSVTAAEDLLAGELVTLGSSGAELTNMTAFTTAGTLTDYSQSLNGANQHKVIDGYETSATSAGSVALGWRGTTLGALYIRYNPTTGVATLADSTLTTGDAGATSTGGVDGCQLTNDKVLVAYKFGAATYTIRAKVITPSSGSEGTEVTVASPGSGAHNFISVMKVSSTEAVVLYTDSAGLKFVQLSISGSTITVGATGTVLADADLSGVMAAEQFSTSDYYLLGVRTSSTSRFGYIICQYASGAFSNVGAKTEITSSTSNASYHLRYYNLSSTKMLIVGMFGADITCYIATRDTLSMALTGGTNLISTINTSCEPSLRKLGEKTFAVSAQPSGSSEDTYIHVFKVKNDYSEIELLGSQTTLAGQSVTRQTNPALVQKLNASQCWVGYPRYAASDYLRHTTYTMTTNYESFTGVCETDAEAGATASIIIGGISDEMSGLTIGAVYADCSGDVRTTNLGTTRRVGVAESATVMHVK